MSRQVWDALGAAMLVAAMLVVAGLGPAAADERATLRVTARVVDRCTVEVPFSVPSWVWRDRQHQPWRFVRHVCRDKWPHWIQAKKVRLERLLERLRDRFDDRVDRVDDRMDRFEQRLRARWRDHDGRVREVRHPSRRDVVLITVTY